MEFDELFVPPDIATDYAAGILTRLFGSIIPRLHGSGDGSIVSANWLETIFTTFNAFCLLAMLVVLSYTIYAMVFDTAADGKTFGQSADTKYTILRVLGGIIGFVPIVGGFSLAQVAFLWLVLQGSAFADVTWRNVAGNMLTGTPLVSNTINRLPENTQGHIQDFGRAFDTLVTGHICGLNANSIQAMLAGEASDDDSAMLARISTLGSQGSIRQVAESPQLEQTSDGWRILGGQEIVAMTHITTFADQGAGTAFSGRQNYCGAVTINDSYPAGSGGGGLEVDLLASRSQQQFAHLATNVMPDLSAAAHDVAVQIYNGERNADALLTPSRNAIYAAVAAYLSGPAITSSISSSMIEDAHDALLEMTTTEGWMLAPVWQRGVASTVTMIEMPGGSLRMESARDNRVSDFLSGSGYRASRDNAVVGDLLVKADADQDTWDELASAVINLPPPDVAPSTYARMGDTSGGGLTQQALNSIYQGILSFFSPVSSYGVSGNFGFVDPMWQVQRQGTILTTAGGIALGTGIAMDAADGSIWGRGANALFGTTAVVSPISSAAVSLGTTLLLTGIVMIVILPLVPMVYFFTAVMSWLLQTVETMFAIPLAVLQLFTPAREATLIGNFSKVLLTVFSVFMRPFFMIVGLILAMMIISVMLGYLHEVFGRLMFFGGFNIPGGAAAQLNPAAIAAQAIVEGAVGLIKMVCYLALYVLIAFLTVLYGSQIISEFGEYAMNLIGVAASRYTQPGAIADKTVLGGGMGYMGARSAAQMPGSVRATQLAARRSAGGGGRQLPGPEGG